MLKKIIPFLLVFALVLAGCGSGSSSVNLKSEGFNKLQSFKEGDAQITVYSGNSSAAEASEIFNDWAVGEGWDKGSDSISFAGYSGQMFEKGKDVMMINIIDAGVMVSVNVTVIKNGAEQKESKPASTPKPTTEARKFIGHDTVFEIADNYREIECEIDGMVINYSFNGRETIDGVETEHISVFSEVLGEQTIEMWVDENNENTLKAILDGVEVPVNQISGSNTLIEYLYFFFSGDYWDSSYEDAKTTDTSRNLGAGRMKITKYTLTFESIGLTGGSVLEVGETDDGFVLVSFAGIDSDDNLQGLWELKKLVKR